MINIAIIHPQPLFREGLILLLREQDHELTVVSSNGNIRQLINKSPTTDIDVILWDIPGHHILNPGTRLLKDSFPLAKILVMVSSHNSVYAGLLETLGANGVIPSDCRMAELVEAVITIHNAYAPPPSSNHVQEPSDSSKTKVPEKLLNSVASLLKIGLTVDEVAIKLNIDKLLVDHLIDILRTSSSKQQPK